MAIKNPAKRQQLANSYASDITHIGVGTGAPGTSPANGNELSGTGPEGAYARAAASSSPGTTGDRTWTNASLNCPATGSAYTVTYLLFCSSASGATVVDYELLSGGGVPIGPQGGVITLSGVKYTQT